MANVAIKGGIFSFVIIIPFNSPVAAPVSRTNTMGTPMNILLSFSSIPPQSTEENAITAPIDRLIPPVSITMACPIPTITRKLA